MPLTPASPSPHPPVVPTSFSDAFLLAYWLRRFYTLSNHGSALMTAASLVGLLENAAASDVLSLAAAPQPSGLSSGENQIANAPESEPNVSAADVAPNERCDPSMPLSAPPLQPGEASTHSTLAQKPPLVMLVRCLLPQLLRPADHCGRHDTTTLLVASRGYVCCRRGQCDSSATFDLAQRLRELRSLCLSKSVGTLPSALLPLLVPNKFSQMHHCCPLQQGGGAAGRGSIRCIADAQKGSAAVSVDGKKVFLDAALHCVADHLVASIVVQRVSPDVLETGPTLVIQRYHEANNAPQQPISIPSKESSEGRGLRRMLDVCPWKRITLYGCSSRRDSELICISLHDLLARLLVKPWSGGEPEPSRYVLHKLRLGGFPIPPAVSMLLEPLPFLPVALVHVQELVLEQMNLDGHFVSSLQRCLQLVASSSAPRFLQRLSLRGNPHLGRHLFALGSCVASMLPWCASLDLALCNMTNQDALQLFQGLSSAPLSQANRVDDDDPFVLHLDLSHNVLSTEFLNTLLSQSQASEPLRRICQALRSLDLSGNRLQVSSSSAPAVAHPVAVLASFITNAAVHVSRLRLNDTGIFTDLNQHLVVSDTPPSSSAAAKGKHPKKSGGKKEPSAAVVDASNVMKRLMKAMMLGLSSAERTTRRAAPANDVVEEDGVTLRLAYDVDFELALGGCRLGNPEARILFLALHDAQEHRLASGCSSGSVFRPCVVLYSCPWIAATLADITTPYQHLVSLDLRSCALGNDATVALAASLERSAPLALEYLRLCDNMIGDPPCGRSAVEAMRAPHTKKRDAVFFLLKALRGAVAPALVSLHVSHNDLSWEQLRSFSAFVLRGAGNRFCELNVSGHTALSRRSDDAASSDASSCVAFSPFATSATVTAKAPIYDLAAAIQHRLVSAANDVVQGLPAGVDRFTLMVRECDCPVGFSSSYGTAALSIVTE